MSGKALLLRVGMDRGTGGALGPIYPDGAFEYIPIPETVPSNCPFTYATLPGRHVSALAAVLPARLAGLQPHIDPDFESCTYGDAAPRKRRQLLRLSPGDLLVFYAGLAPDPPLDRPRLFAVGYFRVKQVHHLHAAELDRAGLIRRFGRTAHFLRRQKDLELALVEGEPGECMAFEKALPLGDERNCLFLDLASFGYQGSLLRAVGHWIDGPKGVSALETWLHLGPASLVRPGTRLIPLASALQPEETGHLAAEGRDLREGDWIIALPQQEGKAQALGRINRKEPGPGGIDRGFSSLYWCFGDQGPLPGGGRVSPSFAQLHSVEDATAIRKLVSWFATHYRIGFHPRS